MRILVADDDKPTQMLLTKVLSKYGYEIICAADGGEAWEILHKQKISLVITDWLMPHMNGLQLCRKIRKTGFSHYIYIIILTSKEDKKGFIEGMKAGADDFIVKPFKKDELHARIRAGERIIKLEKDLEERNAKLEASCRKMDEAYLQIKKDLEAAAKVQKRLLPPQDTTILGIHFNWLFFPCAFIAGDIFNYFALDENTVGFYILDVVGHGIPSAMLSVTLSRIISPGDNKSLLKRFRSKKPYYQILPPSKVLKQLNEYFESDDESVEYFTIIYGIIDVKTGQVTFSQAGHPSPVYSNKRGKTSLIGSGGYPVGMFSGVDYDEFTIDIDYGDRIFLYSDGITDCVNKKKESFSQKRLVRFLDGKRNLPISDLLKDVEKELRFWNGNQKFEDDMTLVAMEFRRY